MCKHDTDLPAHLCMKGCADDPNHMYFKGPPIVQLPNIYWEDELYGGNPKEDFLPDWGQGYSLMRCGNDTFLVDDRGVIAIWKRDGSNLLEFDLR